MVANERMRVRMTSARWAGLSTLDQVASATLPTRALARYSAYRNALLADGQDEPRMRDAIQT
jgi:hypothetical protein